jgi:hypothetical protein
MLQNSALDKDFSLESIDVNCHIDREAFNFLYFETFYSLYPNICADHILNSDLNNFQFNNILWSYFNLMQSSSSNKDERNLVIRPSSFQGYKEENNACTIVTHKPHACPPTSSFVIQNIDLVWNLERNMILSHVIDNTKIFHQNRMLMFELHHERKKRENLL